MMSDFLFITAQIQRTLWTGKLLGILPVIKVGSAMTLHANSKYLQKLKLQ